MSKEIIKTWNVAFGEAYVKENMLDADGAPKETLPSETELKLQRRKVVEPIILADTNVTDPIRNLGIAIGKNTAKRQALNLMGIDAKEADFSKDGKYSDKEKYKSDFIAKKESLAQTTEVIKDETLKTKIAELVQERDNYKAKVESVSAGQNEAVEKMRIEMRKERFALSILSKPPGGKKIPLSLQRQVRYFKDEIKGDFSGDVPVILKPDGTTYRDDASERDLTPEEIGYKLAQENEHFVDAKPQAAPPPTELPNNKKAEIVDGEITKEKETEQAVKEFQEKRKTAWTAPEKK